MNLVILAGGRGTRLWPMSRKEKPKQFFEILSDLPMIVEVYQRLQKKYPQDQIFIATLADLVDLVQALIPELDESHIIVEPCKRDSGPAMAYAAWTLKEMGRGDTPVVFIPTDHFIADDQRFLDALSVGEKLINQTGKLLDISVAPQFPSTTLGYTKIGEKFGQFNGIDVYNFLGHQEKPDEKTALSYLESGNYLWHANYYMWTPNKLLDAYQQYAPEIYNQLIKIDINNADSIIKHYHEMPAISIDYAITEKMDPDQVLIIRGDFGWSDIGAWDVLYDRLVHHQGDTERNVTKGAVMTVNTNRCLIYSKPDKIIATIGLDDLVIIDTDDALLICPKSRSQEVKLVISKLKDNNLNQYL